MKNREIKFRAWNGHQMVGDVTVGKFGNFYVNPGNNGDGLDPNDTASLTRFTTKYHENTPIMQFTGLKDKNGKEIYEGDVGLTNLGIGIVKFERQIGSFLFERQTMMDMPKITSRELNATYGDGETYKAEWLEIIGNIYENPELLNETQKGDSK